MSELVNEFLRETTIPERRKLYLNADEVLSRLDYISQLVDCEELLLSDLDWLDITTIKKAIDEVYIDHLTKVLLKHGIRVYAYCQDIELLTKMIDTLVKAQYEYDPKAILDRLVVDAERSPEEIYAHLVTYITEEPTEHVLQILHSFNSDILYKLIDVLNNTKLVDIETQSDKEHIVTRYKNYLGDKRYGLIYNFVIVNTRMSLGTYDPYEVFLILEDSFEEITDKDDLIFELVGLTLASKIDDEEVPNVFERFSRIHTETPLEQMNFQRKLMQQSKLITSSSMSTE